MKRRHLLVVWGAIGCCVAGSGWAQRPSLRREPAKKTSQQADLRVERFTPQGAVAPGDAISAEFSADVVSEADFTAGRFPEKVFSFDPSLDGREEWDSARQVRFVPARGLRKGTEYAVRINPQLRSAGGQQLQKTSEYKFNTWPLHLTGAAQKGFTSGRKALVELQFSDSVKPQDLQKHLKVFVGKKSIAWRPQSATATANPRIETDPLSTDTVTLRVSPGLTGASGPLAMRSPAEKEVAVKFHFAVESLDAEWESQKPRLTLHFSNDATLENFRKFISVEPPVEFQLSGGGSQVSLIGDFKPETRYQVALKQGLAGSEGELMEDVTLSAWVPAMPPFLEFLDDGGVLSTRGTMKLHISSSMVTTLTVTAHKLFDNNVAHYLSNYEGEYELKRLGREVAKKVVTISPEENHADHTQVDLNELLGERPSGMYAISADGGVAKDAPDYSSWSYEARSPTDSIQLNLSNLGITAKRGSREVQVWVTALDSAEPVAGARVQVYSNKNQMVGEAQTDASGVVTLKGLEPEGALKPEIVVAMQGDDVSALYLGRSLANLPQFDNSGRDFLKEGYEAFVTPERGAYRPGETVRLSGFLRNRDGAPPPGAFPVELKVFRPDGRALPPQIVTPTAEGALQADFIAPKDAPTGYYRARVQLPGTEDKEQEEESYYE